MRTRRAGLIAFTCLTLSLAGCGTGGSDFPSAANLDPLQLQLSASKNKIVVGDTITFTTVISNPNTVPVNVYLGPSYSGVCFANGSSFKARKADSPGWNGNDVLKHQWKTGFCGTCSYSLVVAVPVKGNITYTSSAVLKLNDKGQPYLNFGGSPEHDYMTLPLSGSGKSLIHATHTVAASFQVKGDPDDDRWLPKEPSIANGYAPNPKAPLWRGTMISNDVPLEVSLARR